MVRTFAADAAKRTRSFGSQIVVNLGVDEVTNRFVREFFNAGHEPVRIGRRLAGVDNHGSFIREHDAAGRVSRLGRIDVDALFDFGKAGTEVLCSRDKSCAQGSYQRQNKKTDFRFHCGLLNSHDRNYLVMMTFSLAHAHSLDGRKIS